MEYERLIKIFCFYLPYNLRVDVTYYEGQFDELMIGIDVESKEIITSQERYNKDKKIIKTILKINQVKPILRPLKEFIDNPDKWMDLRDEFSEYGYENFINHFFLLGRSLNCLDSIDFTQMNLFLKYHFDIFGLLDRGLATDINTIKKSTNDKL